MSAVQRAFAERRARPDPIVTQTEAGWVSGLVASLQDKGGYVSYAQKDRSGSGGRRRPGRLNGID
ncbi:MAG: hypothetical protein NVSMB64_27610 [Candidatus Velthaea sp.]